MVLTRLGIAVVEEVGGAMTAPAQKPVTRRGGKIVADLPPIEKTIGVRSEHTAVTLYRQLVAMNLWHGPSPTGVDPKMDMTMQALSLCEDFRPRNVLQAMLMVQMIGVHQAATECLALATGNTGEDGVRTPPRLDTTELRMRQATQLMRLFTEQLDAWASLKGKRGRQKMTVRHVHVHPGGQAIVGTVNGARGRSLPAGEGTGA
jgi:hypothetical protein